MDSSSANSRKGGAGGPCRFLNMAAGLGNGNSGNSKELGAWIQADGEKPFQNLTSLQPLDRFIVPWDSCQRVLLPVVTSVLGRCANQAVERENKKAKIGEGGRENHATRLASTQLNTKSTMENRNSFTLSSEENDILCPHQL